MRRLSVLVIAAAGLLAVAPAGAHELRHERRSLAALPTFPAASQSADEPDLRIMLPSATYAEQVAPVYVDAFQEPGKLLYRFDSMIVNTGGALDLFGSASEVKQKIWPGGDPVDPQPTASPPGVADDRYDDGARFAYVVEETHEHWHFFSAARYSLRLPGGGARVSDKIGFCMFDSFGQPEDGETWWFEQRDFSGETWCRFGRPQSTFVRMGLSRGATDRYSSQREFQYVDITGLAPGSYVLRAEANPNGHLLESDHSDNVLDVTRTLPGVRAGARSLPVTRDGAATVVLGGESVAPDVPARRGPGVPPERTTQCQRPGPTSSACYIWAADRPLRFAVVQQPAHGTVRIDGDRATYTPARGYEGADRFIYSATDARGLTSAPAAVSLSVVAPREGPGVGSRPPASVLPERLLGIARARRSGRAIVVALRCRPATTGSCSGRVRALLGRRVIASRRYLGLRAGSTRTVRLRLSRAARRALRRAPRRRLVVIATVRDANGGGLVARRVIRRG